MSAPEAPGGPIVDVDRLMEDLRARVASRRAAGGYDGALLAEPFGVSGSPPSAAGRIVLRPETAYSSKPFVGRVITGGKRAVIKALFHYLSDLVAQVNAALGRLSESVESEARTREGLEREVRSLEREVRSLEREVRSLERAPRGGGLPTEPDPARVVAAEERAQRAEERARRAETGLATLAARLEAVEGLALGERLARVERRARAKATPVQMRPVDPAIARIAAARAPVDDAGAERIDAYLAWLGSGPVLDLAAGNGALLAALREAGVPARGVEAEEADVARGMERGLDVRLADPLAALDEAEPESLGGIAALGLLDRLGAAGWLALADLASTRLAPGGGLVAEVVNPLTPAGMALRMRDPGLAPPVHPETAALILASAGLQVELRTLGAFAGGELAPLEDAAGDPLAERLNDLAHRMNRALVGEPRVAVLARRPAG